MLLVVVEVFSADLAEIGARLREIDVLGYNLVTYLDNSNFASFTLYSNFCPSKTRFKP